MKQLEWLSDRAFSVGGVSLVCALDGYRLRTGRGGRLKRGEQSGASALTATARRSLQCSGFRNDRQCAIELKRA